MLWDRYAMHKEKNKKVQKNPKNYNEALRVKIIKEIGEIDVVGVEIIETKDNIEEGFIASLKIDEQDSYWAGGLFKFQFNFPKDYPFRPPLVRSITKIYHPNISIDGLISLNILSTCWSPVFDINLIFMGLKHLFSNPNFEDPMNIEVSSAYFHSKELFLSNIQASLHGGKINSTDFSENNKF